MDLSCSPAIFIVVLLPAVNLGGFCVPRKKAVQACKTAVWSTIPAASTIMTIVDDKGSLHGSCELTQKKLHMQNVQR